MSCKIVVILILLAVVPLSLFAQTDVTEIPADYESDGCSLFPDGNYRDCCVAHDRDYYKGGSCRERRESDNRLYRCVKSKKGWKNKIIAPIMWLGVRVFGAPFIPTPYRWGFGKSKKKKEKRKMQVFNPPPEDQEPKDGQSNKPEATTESKNGAVPPGNERAVQFFDKPN